MGCIPDAQTASSLFERWLPCGRRARSLVPETKAALSSWESEHRAAQEQSDASSIDYLEASVVALGESREKFVARSKAAKYVAAALYATMALLLAVSAKLVVLVATDEM